MSKRIPDRVWAAIRRDWDTTQDTSKDIARRHNVSYNSLREHIRRNEWPEKGMFRDDPAANARALCEDLSTDLRESLQILRTHAPLQEPPETAAKRASLINAHRRALAALITTDRLLAPLPDPSNTPASTPLDLEAALQEILTRLNRLAPAGID